MDKFSLDCFDEFTAKFIRSKVRKLVGRAGFTESDRPDLIQDFVLDLLQRRKNFEPSTATWEAFVVVVCKNCYATILKRRQAEMRSHKREGGSLNRPIKDGEGNRTDFGSAVANLVNLWAWEDFTLGRYKHVGQRPSHSLPGPDIPHWCVHA